MPYAEAVARLERARERLIAREPGAAGLFLCEHPPVITLGRGAAFADVLVSAEARERAGIELSRSTRGGQATYHGPGQLMVYPVARVRGSVVSYLEALAGGLARLCADLGVDGAGWRRDPAGLWVGDRKIAACGIHLRRGVAIHGFALNLDTPPAAWEAIIPCGMSSPAITSVREEQARRGITTPLPPLEDIAARAIRALRDFSTCYLQEQQDLAPLASAAGAVLSSKEPHGHDSPHGSSRPN